MSHESINISNQSIPLLCIASNCTLEAENDRLVKFLIDSTLERKRERGKIFSRKKLNGDKGRTKSYLLFFTNVLEFFLSISFTEYVVRENENLLHRLLLIFIHLSIPVQSILLLL